MKRVVFMAIMAVLYMQDAQAQVHIKQKDEGEHRLNLSFTPQQYFNGINISGEGQPQVLHTQNTFGYKMGLDYQRTTRYGLIFGGGISYGSQRSIIDVVYGDMPWFDPQADHPEQLVGMDVAKLNYAFTSKYAALQLKGGYSFKLPASWGKGWRLETTLGVTSRLYLNGPDPSKPEEDPSFTSWRMMYEKGGTSYLSTFAVESGGFANKGQFTLAETFEGYIGISKAVNLGWLRNFSLGLEVGKSLFHRGRAAYFQNNVRNFYEQRIAHNIYESKNLSLGIKVSIGLWPNIK